MGGINWEIRTDVYPLLYIKEITTQDLLHSAGLLYSVSYDNKNGKECNGKESGSAAESLCCTAETTTL